MLTALWVLVGVLGALVIVAAVLAARAVYLLSVVDACAQIIAAARAAERACVRLRDEGKRS